MIKNRDLAMPLCTELEAWCKAQKLPYLCADELAKKSFLNPLQREWISDFCRRWEEIKALESLQVSKGSVGKHDWALGPKCEDGYPVFVDDRQLCYRKTLHEAAQYALKIIAELIADGDYRLNDKPAGFLPPTISREKSTSTEESTDSKSKTGFAVVANRRGDLHMQSFHTTEVSATTALSRIVDTDPVHVIPAKVNFAENGNIRLWTEDTSKVTSMQRR